MIWVDVSQIDRAHPTEAELSNNYDKSWLYTIHDGNYQVAELSNNYDKSWLWKSTLSRSIS